MTIEQLKESIQEITKAIEIIMNCKGYGYVEARRTCDIMISERSRFEKDLKKLEKDSRK